jgi:hypothetical protein
MRAPSPAAGLLTWLIPGADRDAIVGDLLEEASWRRLSGVRLTMWMALHCASIAAGLAGERARAATSLETAREVAAGVLVESGRMLRGTAAGTAARSAVIFAAGVLALALSAELLVGALLAAANLTS